MKLSFLFLLSFISLSALAEDFHYTKADFVPSPVEHVGRLDSFFSDEGYVVMTDPQHGIPDLGLNQVYFKEEDQFVYVKYGIEGNFPIGQIIETPQGFMVHERAGSQNYLLYIRGMNIHATKILLNRMKNKLTANFVPKIRNLIIAEAHANDDCAAVGTEVVAQMTDFTRMSASVVWNFGKNCVSGLGSGAWGATGGRVASGLSNLWQAVRHPIQTAENVANKVEGFITGVASFTRGLVTNPRATLQRAGQNLGEGWNRMVDVVSTMPNDLKIQFICSLIGHLGVDGAIVFFTAGAGSARLAATLSMLASRFAMVARVFSALSSLSASARAGMNLGPEKMKSFMNKLMSGRVPDEDLSHMNDITGADSRLGLGVLSCTI